MSDAPLPPDWGLCPTLFGVPAYALFVFLGLAAGGAVFFSLARHEEGLGDRSATLMIAALLGGALGAKVPVWIGWADAKGFSADTLLSGRTVVGGLVGGVLAVLLVRHIMGIRKPMGNLFAPAVALGFGIGRLGCLCRGCCYGKPTHAGWGLDLGDGVLRWPSQAIEAAFGLGLFAWLMLALRRSPAPGALFRTFMLAFFAFRFLIEFVRYGTTAAGGLTVAQWVSLGVIAVYGLDVFRPNARSRLEADSEAT